MRLKGLGCLSEMSQTSSTVYTLRLSQAFRVRPTEAEAQTVVHKGLNNLHLICSLFPAIGSVYFSVSSRGKHAKKSLHRDFLGLKSSSGEFLGQRKAQKICLPGTTAMYS
jgi:hypothetical protein